MSATELPRAHMLYLSTSVQLHIGSSIDPDPHTSVHSPQVILGLHDMVLLFYLFYLRYEDRRQDLYCCMFERRDTEAPTTASTITTSST
jgi:hypothetical protein